MNQLQVDTLHRFLASYHLCFSEDHERVRHQLAQEVDPERSGAT